MNYRRFLTRWTSITSWRRTTSWTSETKRTCTWTSSRSSTRNIRTRTLLASTRAKRSKICRSRSSILWFKWKTFTFRTSTCSSSCSTGQPTALTSWHGWRKTPTDESGRKSSTRCWTRVSRRIRSPWTCLWGRSTKYFSKPSWSAFRNPRSERSCSSV